MSQTGAKTKTLELLWMVNSTSASPIAKIGPLTPAAQTPKASGLALARAGMYAGSTPSGSERH